MTRRPLTFGDMLYLAGSLVLAALPYVVLMVMLTYCFVARLSGGTSPY